MSKRFNNQFKSAAILLLVTLFVLTGVGCKGGSKDCKEKARPITLEYWTVQADRAALAGLVKSYKNDHPNVNINIRVIDEARYEQALLEAWAEDKGPDIFSINSLWVRKYLSKLEPAPASTLLPFEVLTGTVKKELQCVLRAREGYTPQKFAATFVPQVVNDALVDNQLYGIPLSFDTLALYYNRELFNLYNIITPPDTWVPFTQLVKKMTILDRSDNIVQSAVGLGTAYNVDHSVDIASAIMMQNGARMTDFNTNRVIFDQPVMKDGQVSEVSSQALLFYTDFANFAKEAYTWNNNFLSSRDAFIKGQAAMYFGYAADRNYIRSKGPGLNFQVAAFPQIDGAQFKVNFARYWLETVSKKSQHKEWAWDFILYATSEKRAKTYTKQAKLPTALVGLLESQAKEDPEMEVFNNQAMSAKSWYRGQQPEVAYEIFRQLIDEINNGRRSDLTKYLSTVVAKINQTL